MHAPTSAKGRGRRRALLGAVAAIGAAVLLAGCSTSSGASSAGGDYEKAAKDTKATLTYAVWDENQVKAIKANLEGFNEEYPDIKVNVDVTPFASYWTKLQTQGSSNTLPDVFWMNGPNFQLYAANGKLAPITGEVEAGAIDPAKYSSALNDLYTYDKTQYGVPKDFDTIGVWMNKALFEKAGVAMPSKDWTWDDFQKTGAELSEKLTADGAYGAAGGMDGQTTYYDTIFQAGGNVIDADGTKSEYDTAAAEAGLQFWTDLIASGASPSIKQLTDTTADQWFTSGKLAMYQGGSWFRSALTGTDLEKDVVVYPLPKGKEQATVIHGVSNVVSANTKNKAAAQALQVYLASKQAQQQQGDMGAVIPAYEGTQSAFTKTMPDADLQVFLDAVDYAKPLPVSKNTAAWNTLETNLLPSAFDGSTPVDDVAKQLAQKMDAALTKEQ
ncbi:MULTISPECIES: sugar ABC transporter substrate-binding protein [unclassified Curtobacterium]|jgi:multiple sugar transport system substrate-binding protein|uniref:ABC transporter substrate-binding protein n=1 Tax=unclassified Curtobacterium TaxID=257496 RepID=UPI0008F25580|nr:sugar ABC transporter substrate-binding protein [Curtobacterium sp. YR515]SFF53972.1 carbohydrate ABC transporter substrate-binding protein, CUT1 family (TC 3.A.1.1.-) [Curtobacterium sp. YR515]